MHKRDGESFLCPPLSCLRRHLSPRRASFLNQTTLGERFGLFCFIGEFRQTLSRYTKDQILDKYTEYEYARKRLDEIPIEIAQIRKNKDLSDDEKELIAEVDQYAKILNELLDIYHTVYSFFD